jgi:hypothetical protein
MASGDAQPPAARLLRAVGGNDHHRRSRVVARAAPEKFTSHTARALTDEVKADAAALWSKLLQLYKGGAHTALGYSSWGAYYEAEFGKSGNYGYRLLKSAEVLDRLPMGNSPPSERQARELTPLLDEPEQLREAWSEAIEQHGPQPTAAQVRETVQKGAGSQDKAEAAVVPSDLTSRQVMSNAAAKRIWIALTTLDNVAKALPEMKLPYAEVQEMRAMTGLAIKHLQQYLTKLDEAGGD